MTVFRVEKCKDKPFVMVDKTVLKETTISWKAKGILVYLLSLPDDWKIYESELSTHSCDGIKSTRSGIKELIKAGYIVRQKKRTKGRFMGYEYIVYEHPTVMPKTENGKTENEKRHTSNTDLINKDSTENNDNGATSRSASTSQNINAVDNTNIDTIQQAVAYYLSVYEKEFKEEHPKLKKAQWSRIRGVLSYFADENMLDYDSFVTMIDRHFERRMDTDYNINHFATEGVLQNLFWEALY